MTPLGNSAREHPRPIHRALLRLIPRSVDNYHADPTTAVSLDHSAAEAEPGWISRADGSRDKDRGRPRGHVPPCRHVHHLHGQPCGPDFPPTGAIAPILLSEEDALAQHREHRTAR